MTPASRWITRAQLARDAATIGLAPGDTVMIHASLRAVGKPILGGADALIDAVFDAIGPAGTMLMYVGCESPFDDVGRAYFSPEEEALFLAECPPFDPATARASREFGALAEIFRSRPGVRCSAHVGARMAAYGPRTDDLLTPASLADGHGIGSPLERLYAEGKVLLIGSDLDEVTLLHYAEAIAPIADKRVVHVKAPLLVDGVRTWVEYTEYDSSTGVREWEERFFAQIMERFIASGAPRRGRVGDAESYLFGARELVDFAVPIIVQSAARLETR
ncbi:MAG TPA: aminoglycoside 3-N-acetyltransferase [Candidatus Elarobacter sp.]|jgi:aminoglycoside 3-N-acetyltransferase